MRAERAPVPRKDTIVKHHLLKREFANEPTPDYPLFVAVAGNIGVGKSTITTLIGEVFGWRMFFEPVINNPYLEDYYKDMSRWSFHLQVYFLSKRFEVQKAIMDQPGPAVQDRTIYEDVEIFAPTLHRRGCMDDRDYQNYREVFRNMTAFLKAPDLIIYLHSEPETALERIHQRARNCEQSIPLDFMQDLHAAYGDWIERAPAICPVRIIDTEKVNLRDDLDAQRELLQDIRRLHTTRTEATGGQS